MLSFKVYFNSDIFFFKKDTGNLSLISNLIGHFNMWITFSVIYLMLTDIPKNCSKGKQKKEFTAMNAE